jgi:regulator of sigma E protease
VFALGGPLANFFGAIVLLMVLSILGGSTSVYGVLVVPLLQTWDMTLQLLNAVAQLTSHPDHLSGLVGIVACGGKAIGFNLVKLLSFATLLNLNLAVFNLLPIPILDGGRIVLGLLEKIHPKTVQWIYMPLCILGLVFLVSLMVYATWADILRLMA